jgi:hypothetical protein
MVMRTVGLEVGTGRGGIVRPASRVVGGALWDGGVDALAADGTTTQVAPASKSASGPECSQATQASAATNANEEKVSRRSRIIEPRLP